MGHQPMDVYLNDHLGGATLGRDLARRIESASANAQLVELMHTIAPQIEEDRKTLIQLMARVGASTSLVKRASGWIAEKAGRFKFRGLESDGTEAGALLAVESLALGVRGKLGLWRALEQATDRYPGLAQFELTKLAERAETQLELLERERLAIARRALSA